MYTVKGKIQFGKQFGKRLGFPTANIGLKQSIPEGIYLSQTAINKKWLPSLTFIGAARTFGRHTVLAEVYIIDFKGDLYHRMLTTKLLKKIRNNQIFESTDELVEQMHADEKIAREYFKLPLAKQ